MTLKIEDKKSSILQLSKSGKVVNVQYHENGKESE
jgi:hypothetical protein